MYKRYVKALKGFNMVVVNQEKKRKEKKRKEKKRKEKKRKEKKRKWNQF
jgi:hypothetical protein